MGWKPPGESASETRRGIIFLTTLTQYGLEGYKYQAANYIVKPMRYVRLKAELDQWLKRHRRDPSPSIVVTNDTGTYKIALNSLRYAETFNRRLLLHTEQENIICRKSMKELELTLADKSFARCHTSYLVNLYYVMDINSLNKRISQFSRQCLGCCELPAQRIYLIPVGEMGNPDRAPLPQREAGRSCSSSPLSQNPNRPKSYRSCDRW